jgi:hypothetical protein
LKSNPISVNHPDAATSDILILFAALFIQIVALHRVRDRRSMDQDAGSVWSPDVALGCGLPFGSADIRSQKSAANWDQTSIEDSLLPR